MAQEYCEKFKEMRDAFDFHGVAEHVSHFCKECSELNLKRFAGQEPLFKNRLPIWLQRKENEAKRQQGEEKAETGAPQNANAPFKKKLPVSSHLSLHIFKERKKKVTALSTKEEIDAAIEAMNKDPSVTDGLLQYEIRRIKHITEEEARKEVIALRRKKKAEIKATEETKGPPAKKAKRAEKEDIPRGQRKHRFFEERAEHLPWMPNLADHFPQDQFSCLSQDEQKRLIAAYRSFECVGDFRFSGNKDDIKIYDKKLEEERCVLNNLVVERLYPWTFEKFPVPEYMEFYCRKRAAKRFEAVYGMMFLKEPLETIKWDDKNAEVSLATPKTVECIETIIPGHSDCLRIPSLEDRLRLDTRDLTKDESTYSWHFANRFPIEEDPLAFELCLERGVDIAMDACTACQFMTDDFMSRPFLSRETVIVRTRVHQGIARKVAFISKPKCSGKQYNFVFLRNFSKYGFKSQYAKKGRKDHKAVAKKLKESEPLDINRESEDVEHAIQVKQEESQSDDPLGNIMSAISHTSGASTSSATKKTGKRYAIFRIGNHNVLIRSSAPYQCYAEKIPMLHGKHVTMDTVIEHLPNVGATAMSQEELLFHHCKKIFKQADEHVIIRIGVENKSAQARKYVKNPIVDLNVLQIHRMCFFTDSLSASMEKGMKALFTHRIERFDDLLTAISKLENGCYFLRENFGKMHISAECDESTDKEQQKISFDNGVPNMQSKKAMPDKKKFGEMFEGIDHRFMLQWQVYTNRIPGGLIASDSMTYQKLQKTKNPDLPSNRRNKRKKLARMRAQQGHKEDGSTIDEKHDAETSNIPNELPSDNIHDDQEIGESDLGISDSMDYTSFVTHSDAALEIDVNEEDE